MGRNRGVKARAKRSSHRAPTLEESNEISNAVAHGPPIVAAILGGIMVENAIDELLQWRLCRRNKDAWSLLVLDEGPLSTFANKIKTAYSLKFFDDLFRSNLNVVKNVRNRFAHANRIIDFNDDVVAAELASIVTPRNRRSETAKFLTAAIKGKDRRKIFNVLAFRLATELTQKHLRMLRLSNQAYARTQGAKPMQGGILGALSMRSLGNPLMSLGALGRLHEDLQSDDPKVQALAQALLKHQAKPPKGEGT